MDLCRKVLVWLAVLLHGHSDTLVKEQQVSDSAEGRQLIIATSFETLDASAWLLAPALAGAITFFQCRVGAKRGQSAFILYLEA
jgi:hypothetical protein